MEDTRQRLPLGHAVSGAVLLCLCGPTAAHAQLQTGAADDAQIIEALAPELQEARLLTLERMTSEQRALAARAGPLGFRFEQDLNGDGVTDLLLLGDYQEALARSTFALIATKTAGQWVRAGLLTFHQEFIVGEASTDGAVIFFCLACDLGGRVKWTGSSYAFEWNEPGPKAP